MKDNLDIYSQMNWWNDNNSLLQQMPPKFDYFIEKLKNPVGLKILDIGCGGGLLSEEFAKHGAEVTGVDISENSIKIAQQHAKLNNLEIEYKVGIAENLPFTENFDVVVCTDVLEHVENLEKCLSEVTRVLKPSGIFLYDIINRTILSKISVIWIANFLIKIQLKKIGVSKIEHPVHEWEKLIKPRELFYLFDKFGMKNLDLKGLNFAGFKKGNIQLKIGNKTKIAYIGYAMKI